VQNVFNFSKGKIIFKLNVQTFAMATHCGYSHTCCRYLYGVIFHYFFLSRFPDIQLHELKSTWFRTFLASIVGFGTGLAILRRPNYIFLLWLGIISSFMFLFFQYVPIAISNKTIVYHHYKYLLEDQFIFPGKISAVLAGTIMIVGFFGSFLDRNRYLTLKYKLNLMLLCFLVGGFVYKIFENQM
jgi:hypothetical protein